MPALAPQTAPADDARSPMSHSVSFEEGSADSPTSAATPNSGAGLLRSASKRFDPKAFLVKVPPFERPPSLDAASLADTPSPTALKWTPSGKSPTRPNPDSPTAPSPGAPVAPQEARYGLRRLVFVW